MANLSIGGIEIAGIVACVPPDVEENISLSFFEDGEAEKVIASTGIERRHIADKSTTAGDLCFKAAEKLIQELALIQMQKQPFHPLRYLMAF